MKTIVLFCAFVLLSISAFSQGAKGTVSQQMNAGRIVDGKQLTYEELPYTQGKGKPFSVMIVAKASDNYTEVFQMKGKYYQGDTVQTIPINVNVWNSVALIEISADNPTLFEYYDVFVGFGQDIEGL